MKIVKKVFNLQEKMNTNFTLFWLEINVKIHDSITGTNTWVELKKKLVSNNENWHKDPFLPYIYNDHIVKKYIKK